ncbi:MAG: STAS domain-containing protein [Rhizobiales bacterium]|nr:STAS domain-containing protein [Hyphomicrobiales bacterium]
MKTTFRVSTRADKTYCDLGVTLDLRAAPPLKAALLRALDKQRPLTLDAGSVERLSTACIQLLVACGMAFKSAGLDLTLNEPSEIFSAAFADLGLEPELQQWINEA